MLDESRVNGRARLIVEKPLGVLAIASLTSSADTSRPSVEGKNPGRTDASGQIAKPGSRACTSVRLRR
jgi:hypothetical protein